MFTMDVKVPGRPYPGAVPTSPDPGGRPYRGQSPEQRRSARRRRFLDAGLELFGTLGYTATAIDMLCGTAKVTARYFYENFESREDLLLALYDEEAAAVIEAVAGAITAADPEDVDARITAGMGAFFHRMLDDPRRARIVCVECIGVSPVMERRRRVVLHEFAAIVVSEIVRIAEDVELPRETLGILALSLVGGVNEHVVEYISGQSRPPIEVLISEVAASFRAAGDAAVRRWLRDGTATEVETAEV
jgi:AcrR family transcriptional regulator